MQNQNTIRQNRYDEKNTLKISLKLNKEHDADIIKNIDSNNKQGSIKKLIREGIEKENYSIYDYAFQIDRKKHISIYDIFKTLLKDIDCIICLDSATDLLGYSNGGFRNKIKIYTKKYYDLPYLQCYIVNSFKDIPYDNYKGLKVTTINKTLIDLLLESGDDQILLEAFANFYFNNNNSYEKLSFPRTLTKKANYYMEEGKMYYDS